VSLQAVPTAPTVDEILLAWRAAWPRALELWSRFTRLREPLLCTTSEEARAAGLDGSFAMIRLTDQLVVIDLQQVVEIGLGDLALEIMGHEIGHHILCPATLTDQARMVARMRWALPSVEAAAPGVANLYADLHINDRLRRGSGLRLDEVYRRLRAQSPKEGTSDLWRLYQRMYEILWALPSGDLVKGPLPDRLEGDAQLGSRLIRAYRTDWMDGAAGFAALCLPYVSQDPFVRKVLAGWGDALDAAGGTVPPGLTDLDPAEQGEPLHPARDPRVSPGAVPATPGAPAAAAPTAPGGSQGQRRDPFEYGQILRALGLHLTDHEIAVRYYREAARGHLIPFPTRRMPVGGELLPEGYAPWTVGEPLADIDWLATVLRSPVVVPGVTTVQRVRAPDEQSPPREEPLDLDLYIDSSGSIANPQVQVSYLALAGAIVALSCLRAGGRVHATLWSGAQQFESTDGFVTDSDSVLRIVTGYIGGATAFPIHVLRETYAARSPRDRPVHVLVISDDGVTTMFDADERGASGVDIAKEALAKAQGGGTMVLNLWRWPDDLQPAVDMGWDVETVTGWEQLLAFAAKFARRTYGPSR
jgi:hypothetical protein